MPGPLKLADHGCDGCGRLKVKHRKSELQAQGWTWHKLESGGVFVVCDQCNRRAERAREARKECEAIADAGVAEKGTDR